MTMITPSLVPSSDPLVTAASVLEFALAPTTDGEGTLLPWTWYYAVQYEDAFGNLSPLSALGGPAILRTERTVAYYWTDYEDLPRRPPPSNSAGPR